MKLSDNQEVFLALVRAGLWEDAGANLLETAVEEQAAKGRANLDDNIDWGKVYQLAAEQSVPGLEDRGGQV